MTARFNALSDQAFYGRIRGRMSLVCHNDFDPGMCGIAGYLSFRAPASRSVAEAMCARIVHRGPDDSGFFTDRDCAIGMRRLSIIDLATGHQPISNEDGSCWIVFNGEIYNYQEVRAVLAARGHRFATNSDTEVIVHLHEEEGIEGISRLRGMFAYAV
jgi:asparagine synthase (glutamine-hydrolysing)